MQHPSDFGSNSNRARIPTVDRNSSADGITNSFLKR